MWRSLISFGASPMARAVFSKSTFCCAGAHDPEQRARLRVVVIIILAMAPVVSRAVEAKRRLALVGLLLPLAVAVGFVAQRAAVVAVDPHGAVAMEAVHGAAGCIDGDVLVVHA